MSLFDWQLFADAESFLQGRINELLGKSSFALEEAKKIQRSTSTNIFDWVDHLVLPIETVNVEELMKMGFEEPQKSMEGGAVFRVRGSTLFPLVLKSGKGSEVALMVEDMEDFQKTLGKERSVEGEPNSSFRKLSLVDENDFTFSFVERRGSSGYSVEDTSDVDSYIEALSTLESRKRGFQSAEEGIHETEKLLRNFENKLSKLRLADAFFRAERRYWETRNSATKIQKGRQDEVGLGVGKR